MGAISGLSGSVTYAAGYTVLLDQWNLGIFAQPQDLTPLSPTAGHQQLSSADLLQGAAGSYHCKLEVDNVATFAHSSYITNPEEWMFFSACGAREVTPFLATWRTYVKGLLSSGFTSVSYLDDTTPLVIAGTTAVATLTANAAANYSVPYVVTGVDSGISADDTLRRVMVSAAAVSSPTPTVLPVAGTVGNITLVGEGARQYTIAAILATGVMVAVNRRTGVGDIFVDFLANGAVVPA